MHIPSSLRGDNPQDRSATRPCRAAAIVLSVVVAFLANGKVAAAQYTSAGAFIGPLSDSPKFSAPFAADATTVVTQRSAAGGTIQRQMHSRLFRDSNGRVRIEYQDQEGHVVVALVPNPYAKRDRLYLIDDAARTVTLNDYGIFARFFNAASGFGIATGNERFTIFIAADVHVGGNGTGYDLGTKAVSGINTSGLRFVSSPSGAVDERWESPELGVVVFARHTDAEKGLSLEYTLTNIDRKEPASRLFVMPPDYTVKTEMTMRIDAPGSELFNPGSH